MACAFRALRSKTSVTLPFGIQPEMQGSSSKSCKKLTFRNVSASTRRALVCPWSWSRPKNSSDGSREKVGFQHIGHAPAHRKIAHIWKAHDLFQKPFRANLVVGTALQEVRLAVDMKKLSATNCEGCGRLLISVYSTGEGQDRARWQVGDDMCSEVL